MVIEGGGEYAGIVRMLGCGNLLNSSFVSLFLLNTIDISSQLTSFHHIAFNYRRHHQHP